MISPGVAIFVVAVFVLMYYLYQRPPSNGQNSSTGTFYSYGNQRLTTGPHSYVCANGKPCISNPDSSYSCADGSQCSLI